MQVYAVALGSPKQAIKPQPSLVPRPLPPQEGGAKGEGPGNEASPNPGNSARSQV